MAVIEVNWNPPPRDLRFFAALQIAFFAVVSAWLSRRGVAPMVLAMVMMGSSAVGVIGLVRPAWIKPMYVAWMAAVYPIGWVVSHAVMGVVFYLVLTPAGLAMRLLGRDPMERKFDASASTYWKPRPPTERTERYFKQY